MTIDTKEIGDKLSLWREAQDLRREDVAYMVRRLVPTVAAASEPTVRRYEAGDFSASRADYAYLAAAALVLEHDPEELSPEAGRAMDEFAAIVELRRTRAVEAPDPEPPVTSPSLGGRLGSDRSPDRCIVTLPGQLVSSDDPSAFPVAA